MIAPRIFLIAFLLLLQANACLWVDGTTIDGSRRQIEGRFPADKLKSSLTASPEDRIAQFISTQHNEFAQQEADGVQEVLKGNYDRAIGMFEQTEADHPGRYSTAVNLGTAYELKGELELALKWIREGIRRNSESHLGTEWLHVEILKTRIKLKENPGYLRQNHVIKLPDSYSKTSSIQIEDRQLTIAQIADSIHYQLQERMIFVKPPDPVVADLLFTFGEIEGRTNVVESGIKLFEMANDYGFANPDLITGDIKRYEQSILHGKIWRIIRIALSVLAFMIVLVFAWRKKWFFLSGAAYRKHQRDKQRDEMDS